MKIHAFRLHPDQDLKFEIQAYITAHQIKAGTMISIVGSLKHTRLRLAGATNYWEEHGKQEILSLCGTLSANGSHLHLCVADINGTAKGGHITDGCIINTTAEIVIGELTNYEFSRVPDSNTGFDELSVNKL